MAALDTWHRQPDASAMSWDRRAILLALGAIAATPMAAAQRPVDPAEPIRFLQTALAGAGGAMPSADTVRAAVVRAFDMESIARAVLAGLAPNATASQVDRFQRALTDRITRDLLDRRRRDGRGVLTIASTRPIETGEWLVTTRLRIPQRNDQSLSWRVRNAPRGPVISDIRSSGTSMIRALRNEYEPALRRLGLDGLIGRMEARGGAGR